MNCKYAFLNNLNKIQKKVCISEKNYVLTACPGSGKTKTITYKLAYLAEKYEKSKKLILLLHIPIELQMK